MKNWKRRWALFLAAALLALSLTGCGGSGEGPALSVCVGGAPEELDPIYATETADQTLLVHLYENLMRKTGDGSGGTTVTNGAAKSVSTEENADGTVTWTFKLRKAEWSDGRAVRAGDFVFAWQRLADPANDSPSASLLSVVAGYDAVRETGDVSLLQVTAEDDSTLVVVLNGKFDWFLTEVCTAPATMPLRQDLLQEETAAADGETAEAAAEPAEAAEAAPWWNDLTGLVTNGPYQVSGYEAGEALTLEASETYRNSFSGPQTLTFRFAETAEAGQNLYDAGEVDFLGILPAEQLTALIEAESRTLARELSVQAVVFNCAQDTLMDARVRRALTLTADRSAAAEAAGATAYAAEGLIPPGVPGSGEQDFRTDGGVLLDNDPAHRDELAEEARGLLAVCERHGALAYTACEAAPRKTDGVRVKEFSLLRPVLEADFIIDLPKVKTHVMTGMSCAVKNLFGTVPGLQKAEFHMRFPEKEPFGEMLVDLCETVRPQLIIADGVLAMEGDGPAGGTPRALGLVLGGEDAYAVDLAVCRLMGMPAMRVPYLAAAHARGLCEAALEEALLRGDTQAAAPVADYKLPAGFADLSFADKAPRALRWAVPGVEKWLAPRPKIHRSKCIGCGKCAEICPGHTITVENGKAHIVPRACIRCFCCHEMCPAKAIDVKRAGIFNL